MTRKSSKSKARKPLTTHAEVAEIMIGAVEAIGSTEEWTRFLRYQRNLHQYSPQNRLWFWVQGMQRDIDVSVVASYNTWKSLDRHVCKGEHGLAALAPVLVNKVDEETGDRDKVLVGFKIIHQSFGIGQTDGEPLPEPARPVELQGDAEGWDALVAYAESIGSTVTLVGKDSLGSANGATATDDQSITIRDDLSEAQRVKTLVHEIAHVKAGHVKAGISTYQRHRGTMEVEAESIAYVVTDALGLDSSSYSFDYVAGWASETRHAEKPGQAVKHAIPTICRVADEILTGLEELAGASVVAEAEQATAEAADVVSEAPEKVTV